MRSKFDEQLQQLHVELITMGGLCEQAAQSQAAQALYARMRVLGEANTNYGDYGLGSPAEFDDAALAGAEDALWEAGALPQVFSLWLSDGSLSESGGTHQGTGQAAPGRPAGTGQPPQTGRQAASRRQDRKSPCLRQHRLHQQQ